MRIFAIVCLFVYTFSVYASDSIPTTSKFDWSILIGNNHQDKKYETRETLNGLIGVGKIKNDDLGIKCDLNYTNDQDTNPWNEKTGSEVLFLECKLSGIKIQAEGLACNRKYGVSESKRLTFSKGPLLELDVLMNCWDKKLRKNKSIESKH